MLLTFKTQITPTEDQINVLELLSEEARLLYNHFLGQLKENYETNKKFISYYQQQKELKNYKTEFLTFDLKKEILRTLHFNFSSFFSLVKRKKDLNPQPPKFRGKDYFFTLSLVQDFIVKGKTLRVSYSGRRKLEFELKFIKPIESLSCLSQKTSGSQIKSLKISKKDGLYFASISYEKQEEDQKPVNSNRILSIDLGKKNLLTVFDKEENKGTIFSSKFLSRNQKYLDRRIDELKSKRDLKKKGSRRHRRINFKIKSLASKKKSQTGLCLQKVTKDLSRENKTILIGELSNLKENILSPYRKLNRQMQNNWNLQTFTHLLEYKCKLMGNQVVKVNEAWTSKTCCSCGSIKSDLTLSDRKYKCEDCGTEINRDLNGAINILKNFLDDYNPSLETLRVSERFDWCHINRMNRNYN